MQQTTNYNMNKPEVNDLFNLAHWNENTDKMDDALAPEFEDYTGETEVPSAETALAAITSKTKLGTLMQNIKAFCKGCITLGMLVNNCVTDNANLPLAAAQGKVLMDQLNVLNSNFEGINSRFTKLTANQCLNDIYISGLYSLDGAKLTDDNDISVYGTLLVISNNNANKYTVSQNYFHNDGTITARVCNQGVWSNWVGVTLKSDFPFFVVKKTVSGTNTCTLQSMFQTNTGDGNYRQTIFIFGSANGTTIHGMLTITNNGGQSWSGTGTITASIDSTGRVTVVLPKTSFDDFIFISAGSISA